MFLMSEYEFALFDAVGCLLAGLARASRAGMVGRARQRPQGGAEQLLGAGDMLYLPAGQGVPERVHGAFVGDDEVHRVVDSWKKKSEPNYLDEITSDLHETGPIPGWSDSENSDSSDEDDELYDEAVSFVIESRRASISAVQRKLRIGYNRAARIIEAMEMAGLVSEMSSNGSREVLVPKQQ